MYANEMLCVYFCLFRRFSLARQRQDHHHTFSQPEARLKSFLRQRRRNNLRREILMIQFSRRLLAGLLSSRKHFWSSPYCDEAWEWLYDMKLSRELFWIFAIPLRNIGVSNLFFFLRNVTFATDCAVIETALSCVCEYKTSYMARILQKKAITLQIFL